MGSETACSACAAVYPRVDGIPSLLPLPSDDGVRDFFENVAETAGTSATSYVPFSAPSLDRQLRILSSAIQRAIRKWAPPPKTLLDIGCGHGLLLAGLASSYGLFGIDFAIAMLPVARSRGYQVVHGDARHLPYADDQFDLIVCAEVLQQFEDLTSFLAEMTRVCKSGGSIVITTLNRESLLRLAVRIVSPALRASSFSVPVIRRTPADIMKAAKGLPVTLEQVAWVLSPSPLVVYGTRASSIVSPLATNFILHLRKNAPSG